MTQPATEPTWAVKGANVAEYYTPTFGPPTIVFTTIDRLTATQVVTVNGHRYVRDHVTSDGGLLPVGRKGALLLPTTSAKVIQGRAHRYLVDLFNALDDIGKDARGSTWKVDSAALLASVDMAVDAAKANIDAARAGRPTDGSGQ